MDLLKNYYTNKKQTWAKTKSYYKHQPEWGTLHGYNLLDSYSESEVKEFESMYKISLEPSLRTYLTKVSRETFADYYPCTIDLHLEGTCNIPENVEFVENEYDLDGDFLEGMMQIGTRGCTDNTYIVVKGIGIGRLWELGLGGDALFLKYGTFLDYVIPEHLKHIYK